MMDGASGAGAGISVPVFVHDGERENSIGNAFVHPFLKFNDLQSGISECLGCFPNQISIYLAERRPYRSWPRKIAVNAKFDFATISGGKDLYFLVFLKKSKDREKVQSIAQQRMPENVTLLRRETAAAGDQMYGGGYMVPAVDRYEYEQRMRQFAVDRERYLMTKMMMNKQSNHASIEGADVRCEECEKAKDSASGSEPEFHCCPRDPVVVRFRSKAGPVSRPVKK